MDKNGVSLIGNEDMDGIKVWVANNTPIPVSIEGGGASGGSSLPSKKPKIMPGIDGGSFSTLTTLEDIIPNGFMLLHNDLMSLIKALGGDGEGGGGGGFSIAGAAGVGAALGAGAVGVVKGLFSGFGDESQKHLETIAEKLNLGLTVEDFEDDPDIEAIQKDSFKSYLKAYYAEQVASMAGQAVGSFVSSAAVSAITGVVGGLLEAIGLKEEGPEDKLESMATELDKDFTIEDIKSDSILMEEILGVQKDMFVAYLKTYYAAQISEMAGEAAGNLVGGALKGIASGLVEGTIGTLVSIFTGRKEEPDSLALIAEQLTAQIDVDAMAEDQAVKDEQKKSVIQYLKLYYQAQINEMGAEMVGDTISSTLKESIKGVFTGILGGVFSIFGGDKEKQDEQAGSLSEIVEKIDATLNADDYIGDPDVVAAQKDSVLKYLKVYYDAQVAELAGEGVGKTVGAAIEGFMDSVSGIISGIFGGRDQEEEKTHLQEVVDTITENIKASDYTSDETVLQLQRNTVLEYLRIYYNSQIEELQSSSEKSWFADVLGDLGDAVGGFFSGLFGKEEEQTPFMKAINQILVIDPNKYKDLPEIDQTIEDHIVTAIGLVLDEQNEAILDYFSGDVDGKTKDALKDFRSAYNAAFARSINSINMSNLTANIGKDPIGDISRTVTTINIRLLNILNGVNDILAAIPPLIPVSVPVSTTTDEELLEA